MLKDIVFPPALVAGCIDKQEVRIIYLDKKSIQLESADILTDSIKCKIKILNFNTHEYDEFTFEKCKVVEVQEDNFSYIYKVEIGNMDSESFMRYHEIIDKYVEYFEMKDQLGIFRKMVSNKLLNEDYQVYPYEKDKIFAEDLRKQSSEWYNFSGFGLIHSEFEKLVSNIELAFNINSLKLFKQFEDESFDKAIEDNLNNDKVAEHRIFSKRFSRVYIGNEFCPNIFPDNQQLLKLMDKAYESNFEITLSFSCINESYIKQVNKILDEIDNWCKSVNRKVEIVINDWGMPEILKKYSNLQPVLGRLLNRRKKDPRLKWWWGYDKCDCNFDENILNTDHFIEFLDKLGISRFEFEDNPVKSRIPEGRHSLHFPFYQINTASFCLLYAHCNLKKPDLVVSGCPNYCNEFYLQYPFHLDMIGKGNTIFGFNKSLFIESETLKEYIDAGIDRLVYSVI